MAILTTIYVAYPGLSEGLKKTKLSVEPFQNDFSCLFFLLRPALPKERDTLPKFE